MTLGEIISAYYAEVVQKRKEKENEIALEIQNEFSGADYEVYGIKICFNDHDSRARIYYSFKLQDGFRQTEELSWDFRESVKDISDSIREHIEYIQQLRDRFPELAKQNDYIQKNRVFERKYILEEEGYSSEERIKIKLCGYLKLPNTTSCSVGGGDYELKKTPQRVDDFHKNIDTLCSLFAECISDLLKIKKDFPGVD